MNRTPTDLNDALILIKELRNEIRKRPKAVVIETQRDTSRFPSLFTSDLFPSLEAGHCGYRVEITTDHGRYEFQTCVLVETPDVYVMTEAMKDVEGNTIIAPTQHDTKER